MTQEAGTLVTPNVRLLEPLDAGGMGTVWIAEHLSLDIQVAVKLISSERFQQDPVGRGRFEREAKAAAQIKSPHVVQVFDYGVMDDDTPYIVMELLDGEDLDDHLHRTGAMPLEAVGMVLSQVAKALTAAHQLGIVHRDIKPGNVFLTATPDPEPFIKVLDFGVAKQHPDFKQSHATTAAASGEEHLATGEFLNKRASEAGTAGRRARALTATGVIVGTPDYMSPEQLVSTKDVDHHADLWAMAVLAYHMVTGQVPFAGDTLPALTLAICTSKFSPATELRDGLPGDLDGWFRRALHVEPSQRFESATAAVAAFRAAIASASPVQTGANEHEQPAPSSPEPPTTGARAVTGARSEESSRGPSALLWIAVAILAVGLLIGYVVVDLSADRDSPAPPLAQTTAGPRSPTAASDDRAEPSGAPSQLADVARPPGSTGTSGAAQLPATAATASQATDQCHTKPQCRQSGQCHFNGQWCEVGSDADCAQSVACRTHGNCEKQLDRCAAGTNAHCRNATVCRTTGACVMHNTACMADSPADCRASTMCKSHGKCTLQGVACAVDSDADCQRSTRCASAGECQAKGGRCVKP